ncbi:MAG TPA: tetratricopeptide repeat protein [Vicinamibacterales bacterium]|jgi:tetratricopeptide (TPR) repeat protein|nr:tetratricopeptide repeat protein [Vicinamibacterales bacterium]
MLRMFRMSVLLAAAVGLAHVGIFANGSSMPSAPSGGGTSSLPSMTPEERAIAAYKSGDEHRIKGKKFEDEAAMKKGADIEKTLAKAKSEYQKSLKDFTSAAKFNPQLAPAYNGMGFAYRKTGDYAKALEMYDQAIELAKPKFFSEAVEYRGEAYLALNRIDDARKAYLELFAADRTQADGLMEAMKKWVAAHKTDPAGVSPDAVTGLEKWLDERDGLAKQTRLMGTTSRYSGW